MVKCRYVCLYEGSWYQQDLVKVEQGWMGGALGESAEPPPSSYQLGNLCSGHQKGNLTGEFGFFAHRLYSTITYRYVTQYYLQYSILLINTGTRERVGTSTVSDAFGPNEVGTTYVFTLAPCRI